MARLKAPEKNQPNGDQQKASNLDLMEDLVRASLRVNPGLRAGKSTHEVLDRLADEAVSGGPEVDKGEDAAERAAEQSRQNNIAFFFTSKGKQLDEFSRAMRKKRLAIEREEKAMREKTLVELVDFLARNCDTKLDAATVISKNRNLIRALGATDAMVLGSWTEEQKKHAAKKK